MMIKTKSSESEQNVSRERLAELLNETFRANIKR
jgi:hypothetical protein